MGQQCAQTGGGRSCKVMFGLSCNWSRWLAGCVAHGAKCFALGLLSTLDIQTISAGLCKMKLTKQLLQMNPEHPFGAVFSRYFRYFFIFIVYCLLFIVYCLLFIVYCLLFIVYCLLFVVYCLLFIVIAFYFLYFVISSTYLFYLSFLF